MSRTWVNGSPPFLNADNLNALEADVTTALGVPDAALASRVVAGATAAALNATYAPASGSSSYAPTNGGDTTNLRALALNKPTFDGSFTFSKISATQDGLIAVKDLTVTGGFGGQVGQGGPISYFKAIGIAGHHSGAGNYDHFWGSVYHDGTREAGMFIGDITGRRGGNVYGAHFLVESQTTAPPFMVGASFEVVPLVARGTTSTNTVGTAIPASTTITSVTLGTAVQLTDGTNIAFTAADSSKVVAYVNGSMGASSTTVPVTPFTTASPISSGSSVTVGVASAYFGTVVRNSGNQTAGAAIQIEAPEYTGDKATVPPFLYGLNLDASASSAQSTGINFGGSWATGINMNGTTIVQAGSIAGVGSSPNRDVRLVDNLLLDNSRYIKMKNAAGTAKGVMRVGPTDNLRFIAPGATDFQFWESTESTMVARITSSGRGDFSIAGLTTKYTSGATQPAYLTNGQVEVWHDTGSGNDYLVVNVNGVSKKVALA